MLPKLYMEVICLKLIRDIDRYNAVIIWKKYE